VFFFKFYFCCATTLYSFLVGLKPLIPVIFLLQREVEEGRKGFQLAQTCSVAVQVVSVKAIGFHNSMVTVAKANWESGYRLLVSS
jgi:hypothetical protein